MANLLTYTQAFDNAVWTKTGASVTGNAAAAPDGTMTAGKLVESVANSNHLITSPDVALTDSTTYVASVYSKQGERAWLDLQAREKSGTYYFGIFNLSTGVVDSFSATIIAQIFRKDDGSFRCMIAYPSSAFGGSSPGNVVCAVGQNASTWSYAGDGTSGIYLWGAQLEVKELLPYQRVDGAGQTYPVWQPGTQSGGAT